MKRRQLHYNKCLVIVHGRSEWLLCKYIKQNQRLKMSIDAKDNGKHSIQITSLNAWLNQSIYSSAPQFLEYFEDIDQLKGRPTKNFKIFIIMDTDDCSKTQLAKYKSKEMFKQHWAHSYIVPIFNTNNLEEVVRSVAIPIEKKKEYINIFPSGKRYKPSIDLNQLYLKLLPLPNTNMDEFIKFCLEASD